MTKGPVYLSLISDRQDFAIFRKISEDFIAASLRIPGERMPYSRGAMPPQPSGFWNG
jgi:hypothetical protein